jgi:serine protease Do
MVRSLTRWTFVAVMCPLVAWAQSDPLSSFNDALEKVVAKVAPAVVEVEAIGLPPDVQDNNDNSSHGVQLEPQHSIGAGVILDPAGYIITNAHIVKGATSLTVALDKNAIQRTAKVSPNATAIPARLIGEFEEADLAVIKVEMTGLSTISFNTKEELKQGQLVVALGSPQGLQNTVSIGVVSSAGRQISADDHLLYVQTDAAINPGNSGGPLVDIKGNLVGINSFFMTEGGGSEGLGFAIPGRFVQFVYQSIRQSGNVPWGDPGVRVQGITPTLAAGLHLPRDSGVVVSDVVPRAPAETSGIKAGDIIATADGKPLENVPQYYETMYHKAVGDKVALAILRHSRWINLEVPIAAQTAESEDTRAGSTPAISLVPKLGILCSELGAKPRMEIANFRSRTGVLVEAKTVGSELQTNLLAGDVIRSVNLISVSNVVELQSFLDKAKAGAPIVLQIERKSQFLYVPVDTN